MYIGLEEEAKIDFWGRGARGEGEGEESSERRD